MVQAPLDRTEIVEYLNRNSISRVYYMSPLKSIDKFLDYGLLSKNNIGQLPSLRSVSFADEAVQERRHNVSGTTSAGKIRGAHDMVPFYFTTRNPTSFKLKSEHILHKMVFWSVKIEFLLEPEIEFFFSDGNLGSTSTEVFFHQSDMHKLPLDVINAEYWIDHVEGKRKRNAELLVYGSVSIDYIECLYCQSEEIKRYILERNKTRAYIRQRKPIEANMQLYFT